MIYPTAAEVLATVLSTFSRDIVPELASGEARSSAATIEHLLRHVLLRIDHEGEVLLRDIERLRTLLSRVADWLDELSDAPSMPIREALAADGGNLATLSQQCSEALRLRAVLVSAQGVLDDLAPVRRDHAGYADVRAAIGAYIAAQLEDEASLIEPAFSGKGPRR